MNCELSDKVKSLENNIEINFREWKISNIMGKKEDEQKYKTIIEGLTSQYKDLTGNWYRRKE